MLQLAGDRSEGFIRKALSQGGLSAVQSHFCAFEESVEFAVQKWLLAHPRRKGIHNLHRFFQPMTRINAAIEQRSMIGPQISCGRVIRTRMWRRNNRKRLVAEPNATTKIRGQVHYQK
jgi:hypothetical protein